MRICAAGRLKTLGLAVKARAERAAVRNHKVLVGSPAPRGEALRRDHRETLLRCRQVQGIAKRKIGLCRGTQRIDMAVGMFSRQRILAAHKCCEEFVIEKAPTELPMNPLAGQVPRQELIFRQGVALIPGVLAEILAGLRMLVARYGVRRQIRQRGSSGTVEGCACGLIEAELLRIEQAADELIVGVGGEAIVAIEAAARVHSRREAVHQALHFGARGRIPGDRVPRASALIHCPCCGAGREGVGVVPAAEILARRGKARAHAKWL